VQDQILISADMDELPPSLQLLLTLWREKNVDGGLPGRSAFSPRDLKPWLSTVHVYEAVENQRFTARLLGTGIVAAIGADQIGRTFGEHDRDLLATRAYRVLTAVTETGRPHRTKTSRIAAVKQSWHAAESVWLPLGQGASVQQVLAATVLTIIG
jgi:hypothetical protein